MSLADVLVNAFGLPDRNSAKALIMEGYVKVNSQVMTNPAVPVSSRDTIIVDEAHARKTAGYWNFRHMNNELEIFRASDDVIAEGLSKGELDFLEELNVSVRLPSGHAAEKQKQLLANTLVLGIDEGPVKAISVLEDCSGQLLKTSKAIIRVSEDPDFEGKIETIRSLAQTQGFVLEKVVSPEYSRGACWAILSRS